MVRAKEKSPASSPGAPGPRVVRPPSRAAKARLAFHLPWALRARLPFWLPPITRRGILAPSPRHVRGGGSCRSSSAFGARASTGRCPRVVSRLLLRSERPPGRVEGSTSAAPPFVGLPLPGQRSAGDPRNARLRSSILSGRGAAPRATTLRWIRDCRGFTHRPHAWRSR